MQLRFTVSLTIVLGLLPTTTEATTFVDSFTDNTFTQQHWTFFDIDENFVIGPATGVSGGGHLALSSPTVVIAHTTFGAIGDLGGSIVFDGPTTRVRGGVRWTQQQLDDGLRKTIFVRGNLGDLNGYFLNMDPGSVGPNFFSLIATIGSVGTSLASGGSPGVYQADVDYNFEFLVDADALSGRLWTGNNYDMPIFTVSANDTQIPSGMADGNVFAGIISNYGSTGPDAISDSLFLPNSQFGGVFEVVPEPSTFILTALGLLGLVVWGWRRKR